jgi:hypothetical protein
VIPKGRQGCAFAMEKLLSSRMVMQKFNVFFMVVVILENWYVNTSSPAFSLKGEGALYVNSRRLNIK